MKLQYLFVSWLVDVRGWLLVVCDGWPPPPKKNLPPPGAGGGSNRVAFLGGRGHKKSCALKWGIRQSHTYKVCAIVKYNILWTFKFWFAAADLKKILGLITL